MEGRSGLPNDDREAARHFRLAADQGTPLHRTILRYSTSRAVVVYQKIFNARLSYTVFPPIKETLTHKLRFVD